MDKALKILAGIKMTKNGPLLHIRQDNEIIWRLERDYCTILASGVLGEFRFDNLLQVFWYLQGHGVSFDDIYFDCI